MELLFIYVNNYFIVCKVLYDQLLSFIRDLSLLDRFFKGKIINVGYVFFCKVRLLFLYGNCMNL